ncbi:MAG: LemA family protein [Micromonosporaceae bacterium]
MDYVVLGLLCCVLPIVLPLGIWLIVSYNTFVRQLNGVHTAWRQVDVELQRRHDLIPNLVETVRGAAAHERTTLQRLVEARNGAIAARAAHAGAGAQSHVEQQLAGALTGVFGVAEAYPQLRANRNFLHLQHQLSEAEDRLAAGRRFYNGNVREYNTRIESFPSNMVAKMGGFHPAAFFQVEQVHVRAVPRAY